MRRGIKRIVFVLLVIFLLMQVYQPALNISHDQDISLDFTSQYTVPKNIETMLKISCYDCHSNNTNYPWYSSIQPGASIMANHIDEGKKELNFSEFGNYSNRRQKSKLKAIAGQINSNEMPLLSYTIFHKNAILNKAQKEEISYWINTLDKVE